MNIIKKVIDYGVWVLFFVFFSFSTLFYFSKDAIPGDRLYSSKLFVEKVTILASSLINKQVDMQLNFFSKRLDETTKVLSSSYASESLVRLDTQVETTAVYISQIKNPVERKIAAQKYVAELNHASTVLKNEQITIQQNSQTTTATTPTTVTPTTTTPTTTTVINNSISDSTSNTVSNETLNSPTKTPKIQPTAVIPTEIEITPTPSPEPVQNQQTVVSQQLEQSQENITSTIDQMNLIINAENNDSKDDKNKDDKDKEDVNKEDNNKKDENKENQVK